MSIYLEFPKLAKQRGLSSPPVRTLQCLQFNSSYRLGIQDWISNVSFAMITKIFSNGAELGAME